jgi:epoxyqueuosine reductase QueG
MDLAELLKSRGASLVGYANLSPVPAAVRRGLPRGVALAVALSPDVVLTLIDDPTRDYYAEYVRVNDLLNSLAHAAAEHLAAQGYAAFPQSATVADLDDSRLSVVLPHKTVATRAGLGWVGRCALLITPEYGSAVRLGSVLTDAPLPAAKPILESRCGDCVACVDACPGGAPMGGEWKPGMPRDAFFDARACYRTALARAQAIGVREAICGRCICACPWTQAYLERTRR